MYVWLICLKWRYLLKLLYVKKLISTFSWKSVFYNVSLNLSETKSIVLKILLLLIFRYYFCFYCYNKWCKEKCLGTPRASVSSRPLKSNYTAQDHSVYGWKLKKHPSWDIHHGPRVGGYEGLHSPSHWSL